MLLDDGVHAPLGLTSAEARRRLDREGPNALPGSKRQGVIALAAGVLREPMFLLLIGAVAIYLVLGDMHEALVLGASIAVILAITVVQERRTERTLETLRDLSSPRALVMRDGTETRIAGAEVVRGDLLILREGDRVAADGRLVEAHDLLVDESLLTGESVPVGKSAAMDPAPAEPQATRANVFSATLVVKGTGRAVVVATGMRSELGRIGASLEAVDSGKTSLESETARIVRVIAAISLGLCVVFALLYVMTRGDVLAGILAGLTLAMALLPEELPVVLTIFLALGAWRIAKQRVLTRRMPAIEMLGAATVLCCDKTGTLTENRMKVVETWIGGQWREAPQWAAEDDVLLETAARACEPDPFDPMERAILAAAHRSGPPQGLPTDATLQRRYPLAEGFLAVCHGWRYAAGHARLAIKGAPETVLALCPLSPDARAGALEAASAGAARGLRLLAVAQAEWEGEAWLPDPS
ncbi:MAG TPA: HAD-IC family P-type ATPase, partial [Usitatibacter sp.]